MKYIFLIFCLLLISCKKYEHGNIKFEIEKLDLNHNPKYRKITLTNEGEKDLTTFINNYTKLDNRKRGRVMPHYNVTVYSMDGKFLDYVRIFKTTDGKTRHISEEEAELIDKIMSKTKIEKD